ncbi:leucyl aminopeptidase family protein [Kiloniella sp. b19]|uniref:leucyl aminopeptidase family protein n=1 Tax=Kiloniella sp. GXU_MW_B19 TaxID=3141326 RepID=UPI0031D19CFF
MHSLPFCESSDDNVISLVLIGKEELESWLELQTASVAAWVRSCGFTAAEGSVCLLPAALMDVASGPEAGEGLSAVLAGTGDDAGFWSCAGLTTQLPEGDYVLDSDLSVEEAESFALAWALGSYRFSRYKAGDPDGNKKTVRLVWPEDIDQPRVEALARAVFLTRDLVNTPANDMGPEELAAAARTLADSHGADYSEIVGDDLVAQNFPAIYEVGKASTRAPRLVDLKWGSSGPAITLVGKGVCFDTGGLDLKPASNMLLMKKDMGGAAHVLGLASAIMETGLSCRLRVLIPAVENAVAGNAFRPGDVINTRKGMTVEVGNTDAEGRLVLCDVLDLAASENPDVILDFATLTGAARVALGADLPALFSNSEDLAHRLRELSVQEEDEVWQLPLHRPYRKLLKSAVADINNISGGGFGGAITAALYLAEFVPDEIPWAHLDIMAWNASSRPGRPEGGEALGLRAAFALVEEMVGES